MEKIWTCLIVWFTLLTCINVTNILLHDQPIMVIQLLSILGLIVSLIGFSRTPIRFKN